MTETTTRTDGEQGSQSDWDAIVVGSGPGGLTTAAYLAAAGRRVLVVEQHDVAGGNAQVFRRQHGDATYEFDVGLHYLGDCTDDGMLSKIFRVLGVGDRIAFRELDPDGFDVFRIGDREFAVPTGWEAYRDRLVEYFPDDAEGIDLFVGTCREVVSQFRMAMVPGAAVPAAQEWGNRTLAELYDHCGLSQEARAVLSHWCGLYGSAPSETVLHIHALIVDHYMAGAWYPEGGGQVFPARLVQVIEALGGEVRTLATVERIAVDAGKVIGVEVDGELLSAPLVISNADHRRTVLELVDREHWDPATVRAAEEAVMALGLIVVYVVVDIDLTGGLTNANRAVFHDADIEEAYAVLEAGRFPDDRVPFSFIAMASKKDPDNLFLCPPGHTNFQIMTIAPRGYGLWGVEHGPTDGTPYRRNAEYRQRKEWITEQLLDDAEQLLGPFRDHIVHLETATPLTHERYTRSSGGTSYGLRFQPDQAGVHRPAHRTEIEGLWRVGASTRTGHGIGGAMIGGVMCAGEILERPLILDVVFGTQMVDPDLIPPDPVDFDPLEISRGAALRARRAEGRAARAEVVAEPVP
jgi:phytoene dehydrogenase-like protein